MRRMTMLGLLALFTSTACDRGADDCRKQYAEAQRVVAGVKADSLESVQGAVKALDGALSTCEAAKQGSERENLTKARAELAAQAQHLERRAARKRREKLTPEQLDALVKNGDPSCPKGQAYRNATLGAEIRCTGPQLLDMSLATLKDYYEERRFKLTTSDAPPSLRAEFGAELYVFTFDQTSDSAAPRCVTVYPPPGIGWQESVARMSGAKPEKLKAGGSVSTARGELPITVDSSEQKLIVRIGECQ